MGKYGKAAIEATKLLQRGVWKSPTEAWSEAVTQVFPDSASSQEKGCPRGAYLGLCEEGLIRGVSAGSYTRSVKNKRYAIEAVYLLASRSELAENAKSLWAEALQGEHKTPNSQMDVVITLWKRGMISY